MEELINLLLALPLAVIANIASGAIKAGTKHEFDWEIFKAGILKGLGVYFTLGLLIGVGLLLPNLEIVINGASLTVLLALKTILFTAISAYVVKAVVNLIQLFNINVKAVSLIKPDYSEPEGLG